MLRIRVEFKDPEIFHDEILTYVDCEHIQSLNNFRMLLVISPRITINVKFDNIKHLSPVTL